MTNRLIFLVAALSLALGATTAQAQKKMYRCGSNFQDRPCDQAPAAPKAAAPAPAAKSEAAPSKAAFQQKLRCENYSRQMNELKEKQKALAEKSRVLLDAQIKSLEGRMKGDSC